YALLAVIFFHFFFYHYTATTVIYTLSLHDALPICSSKGLIICTSDSLFLSDWHGLSLIDSDLQIGSHRIDQGGLGAVLAGQHLRSEEHTSELQSRENLVCRLLLEKKKKH